MRRDPGLAMSRDWWGPSWSPRAEIGLRDLVRTGLVPLDLAALFWELIDRSASIVVTAGPSGAGKTTLVTGLLDLLPESKARFSARGMYETFDALSAERPESVAILVNEISPHLPAYLWGAPVRQLFELSSRGFQFFATCHAESVEEFVYSLCSSPLRLPAASLAEVDALVFLRAWRDGDVIRRTIERVVSLRGDDRRGIEAIPLYANRGVQLTGFAAAFQLDAAEASQLSMVLEHRTATLWERFAE